MTQIKTTFDERVTIETSLRDRLSFREIGDLIGKDPSTISKEIRGHYKVHANNLHPYTLKKRCVCLSS